MGDEKPRYEVASMHLVCRRVESVRVARGLTQQEFAKELGITQQVVSGWATGKRPIPREHWADIANILAVPPVKLFI